jgi:hypothetical protein
MRFVDTNIPLYEVSTQVEDQAKRRIATRILSERDLAVSTPGPGGVLPPSDTSVTPRAHILERLL